MKISNSKKQLAKIISENGGWPRGAEHSSQDGSDGQVSFYKHGAPIYNKLAKIWNAPGSCVHMYGSRIEGLGRVGVIKNFHQTILSREEYFHLYPATDADGWIEWKGGECPVEDGAKLDLKFIDGDVVFGVDTDWSWVHEVGKCNIIAYRLHHPEHSEQEYPDGIKPIDHAKQETTIEQLAADYRNAKYYADRKQQEADDAKADAEAKLAELVAAGKALGLVLSVAEPEPELVITDWRDLLPGDEVEYVEGSQTWSIGLVGVVQRTDDDDGGNMNVRLLFGEKGTGWPRKWRFIRRPAKGGTNA